MAKIGRGDDRVVFRKHDRIGANDAEEDGSQLASCFVDTGDLDLLRDCESPERIVLGRTGSGKTALLLKLRETEDRCIEIKPESLALSYISNSTILQFFEAIGVNLETFYKLIWRHAFCVELLKARFQVTEGQGPFSRIDKVKAFFRGKSYSAAIKYLEDWGDKFWEQTDIRFKEITENVEKTLKGTVKGKLSGVELSAEAARKMSSEQKLEFVHRAQEVVNAAHVPQLNQIIELVDAVLDDPQKKYFLVIDRLDESWVDEQLRYRLIMALVNTVKDFRRVKNAKIVVALRLDLLQRVFQRARPSGFQEEKFESLYMRLTWTPESMKGLIDARVNHVFRDRYSKSKKITARDIMVQSRREADSIEYILDRTFLRPRDVISYFNHCLQAAEGGAKIAMNHIRKAEEPYSTGRLNSVADEWRTDYPSLMACSKIFLQGIKSQGSIESILLKDEIQDQCLSFHTECPSGDILADTCQAVVEEGKPCQEMLFAACCVLHQVGIIGVKLSAGEKAVWQWQTGRGLTVSQLSESVAIQVHPMFWRALGIEPAR